MSKDKKMKKKKEKVFSPIVIFLFAIGSILLLFNQVMIYAIGNSMHMKSGGTMSSMSDLSNVDLSSIKSTAQSLAAIYPLDQVQKTQDAMEMIFPKGTPDYGEALGVSFDDPIGSLDKLSKMYPALRTQIERDNPAAFNRFLNLASKPLGISCEYCCGLETIGIDSRGNSICGCQHNPAILAISLWLSANSDYSDAQILREALRWKTLFFPKDMIGLATSIGTGQTNVDELPEMVGGC